MRMVFFPTCKICIVVVDVVLLFHSRYTELKRREPKTPPKAAPVAATEDMELGRTPKTFGGITKRQANTLITDLQDEIAATNAYEAANGI